MAALKQMKEDALLLCIYMLRVNVSTGLHGATVLPVTVAGSYGFWTQAYLDSIKLLEEGKKSEELVELFPTGMQGVRVNQRNDSITPKFKRIQQIMSDYVGIGAPITLTACYERLDLYMKKQNVIPEYKTISPIV